MERVILDFDLLAASAELRLKAVWPKNFDEKWMVPHLKGLEVAVRINQNFDDLDADGERASIVVEIGSQMTANDEVRPNIYRFDASWGLTVLTAVGILLTVPQRSGWIPCDLVVPAILVEVDGQSFGGGVSMNTLVTLDFEWVELSDLGFAKLLLHTGLEMREFFELGRRLRIDTPLAGRNRGLD